VEEYEKRADPWPLNPDGELLLGLKEEDKYALANVSANLKTPGIGMTEWGPGDMALSLGVPSGRGSVNNPKMKDARSTVLATCKANHIAFLNSLSAADVVDMIKEGVMVGPASQQTAEIGRKFTNRQMPW
jgi:4-hydroxy-2-oxoheptanedioate aldolase